MLHRIFERFSLARALSRMLAPVLLLAWAGEARAAHYAGGSITWECVGPNQYEIHLDLFLDCTGFTIIPQDITFTSDCGTTFTVQDLLPTFSQEVSQLCAAELANSTCNGGTYPGMMWYQFTTVQVLPPCDSWHVSWNICCRSNAVDLIGNQGMYISAEMNTLDAPCNNSPVFTDQSLPYVCVNQPVYYNFGVTEPDGNTLSYSLIDGQLYSGGPQDLNYQMGFTGGAPVPGITVDPITGQIVFTPTVSGNYVVVMQVEEYDTNGNLIGVVMRDIVFVVLPCTGNAPETLGVVNNTGGILTGTSSIEVCDGEYFCVDVQFTDTDPGTLLQVVSQATALLPGGTFTIVGANPATATICWTGDLNNTPVNVLIQADDGSCPIENTASIAVNITTVDGSGVAPPPGTNGSVQVCPGSAAFFLISVLGGTPDVNGFWTDPFGNPHSAQFDPLTDPAGVYTYTVGTACASASATATVTYQPAPDAGVDALLSICSSGAAVNLFGVLGGSPDPGGSWTAPGGAPFSGTYDPAVNGLGAYTYSVAAGAGCPAATATVTVTENVAPNAGTNGTATFCSNGAAAGLIAFLGGVPQVGGTWTAPGGAPFAGTYAPAVQAPGVYTYTVTGTPPCGNAVATVTVTENTMPEAGTSDVITVCSNGASFGLIAQLNGTPDAGGVWTAPGGAAHANTYDPAVDVPGVYVYTVTGTAPCPNDAATITVTENLAPNAGANGSLSICANGGVVALIGQLAGAQAGGAWTAPGGAAFSGSYNPPVDGPGIYTYSVPGTAPCAADVATVTVTEQVPPNAGSDGVITLCGNNLPTNLQTLIIGAQVGGSWTDPGGLPFSGNYDPAVDASGTYTYTVSGVAPCPDDVSTVVVTENAPPNAGADASLTICSDGPATALFPLLVGAGGGGSWTTPLGGAFGGTYDPTTHAPGNYTYSIPGAAPCLSDAAIVTVTENSSPNAGTDGTLTLCGNGAVSSLLASLGGIPQAGGVWSGPSPVVGSSYDPATMVPGDYDYTVTGIAPCVDAIATVTVTENPAPDAGLDGSLTVCDDGSATSLVAQLGGTPQGGGSWSGPSTVVAGLYDPATMAPGAYVYSVPGMAPCAGASATVTVIENPAPDAGVDGALTLCSDDGATVLLSALGGLPQAGGVWIGPSPVVGGQYDPATMAPGAYVYTVAGTMPCVDASATVMVTENPAPNAGPDGALITCSASAPSDLFLLLAGAPAGGTWTAPGGAAFSGVYDPASDGPGAYTYTVNGIAPCGTDQATVDVVESPAPDAGTDGAVSVCDQGAPVDLFAVLAGAQPGGTWTAPGGGAFGGTYDPAIDGAGIFTYNIAGVAPCVGDVATVTVTEALTPNAGSDGALTLCGNDPVAALFNALGGGAEPGGVWTAPGGAAHGPTFDPTSDLSGVYTYAIAGTAPCAGDQSQVTVVVNAPPFAGVDAATTVCDQGAVVDLFGELAGAQPGGTWTGSGGGAFGGLFDPGVDVSGVYSYSIPGTAPCAADLATVSVTVTGSPSAGADGALTLCSTGTPTGLFSALTGGQPGGTWTAPGGIAHNGMFDPAMDAPGIYLYVIAAAAPCLGDQSQVTVTVIDAPQAGADASVTLCDQGPSTDLFAELIGADPGGTWTAPGGGAFSGLYDPAVNASGSYTYTVNGSAPCAADQAILTVNESGTPNAGTDGALTLCSYDVVTPLFSALGGGAQPGGSWTAPGGAPHGTSIDPDSDPAGVYLYTIAATAPCAGDQSQVTVTINAAPDAGTDGSVNVCDQGGVVDLFAELTGAQPGGSWAAPGGGAFSGNYDPMVHSSGLYTYTVNGLAPCADDQSTVTVVETSSPDAGGDGVITVCATSAGTDLFSALSGAQPGGSWSDPGGALHSGTLDPLNDNAGTYTYTLSATAPCTGDQSEVQVTIVAPPAAGTDGAITICDQGTPVDLFTSLSGADVGGTWTAPGGGAFPGIYDPAIHGAGAYTYAVPGMAPCAADQAVVNVSETGSPNAGVDGSIVLCQSGPVTDLLLELTGAQPGGAWTSPGGGPHSGQLDPAVDASGSYVYVLAATPPCTGDQAAVVVTIIPSPSAGGDLAVTVCDQGAPLDLSTQLTGEDAGGSWTAPGGGAFSGIYDPSLDAPGSYTYTVVGIAPCASDASTVTVSETGSPNAGTDGLLTLCSTAPGAALFTQLGGGAQPGGIWTAPGGSSHSGVLDPTVDPGGDYTYTINGTPPCGSSQALVSVVIEAAPDAGLDGNATLCAGDAPLDLLTGLGGTPDTDGAWTDPLGAPVTGTFDPSTSVPGPYVYTVGGPVCGAASATIIVNVIPGPNAGQDNNIAVCDLDAPFALLGSLLGQPEAGGTWTGPDGLAFAGVFDPAVSPNGAYTYVVPSAGGSCPDAQAVVTITVSNSVNAGSVGALTLCASNAPVQLFSQLSGSPDPGGSWMDPGGSPFAGTFDPASSAEGVYTYTVQGQAPCPSSSASLNVEVNDAPEAGESASTALCSSDGTVVLVSLLGGTPQPGGTWMDPNGDVSNGSFIPGTSVPGSYTYTIAGIAPCTDDQSLVTVTVAQAADAGTNGAITVCADAEPFQLFPLLGGGPDAGGSWTTPAGQSSSGMVQPATDPSGAYTYTIVAPAPCPQAQAAVQVTINPDPEPAIVFVMADGCAPVEVSFSNANGDEGTYSWDFGNGTSSDQVSPDAVTYDASGVYPVTLSITGISGCTASTTVSGGLTVFDRPVAAFTVGPANLNTGAPEAYFQNQSIGAVAYEWAFDELGSSTEINPHFTFPSEVEGLYTVCLTAFASAACYDTTCVDVPVPMGAGLFVPNAFSPNGDDINDVFTPFVSGLKEKDYEFMVFDRWGKALFNTTRIGDGWDGRFGDGTPTPGGVYIWKLIGRERYGTGRVERTGHVTLLR